MEREPIGTITSTAMETMIPNYIRAQYLAEIGFRIYERSQDNGVPDEDRAAEIYRAMDKWISDKDDDLWRLRKVDNWDGLLLSSLSDYALELAIEEFKRINYTIAGQPISSAWYEQPDFDYYLHEATQKLGNYILGPLTHFVGKRKKSLPENYITQMSSKLRSVTRDKAFLARVRAGGFTRPFDSISLYYLQQRGYGKDLDQVVIPEDQLASIQALLDTPKQKELEEAFQLSKEILEEIPHVTDDLLEELLTGAGITDRDAVHSAQRDVFRQQRIRKFREWKNDSSEKLVGFAARYRKYGMSIPDELLQIISELKPE